MRDGVFLTRKPGEGQKDFKKRLLTEQDKQKPFFDETLAPGTAVVMTLEANLLTQHSVPKVDEAGPSGSIVFRTIKNALPAKVVEKRREAAAKAKAKREEKKRLKVGSSTQSARGGKKRRASDV